MYTLRANTPWGTLILENCLYDDALHMVERLALTDYVIESYVWNTANNDPDDDYEPYLECAA